VAQGLRERFYREVTGGRGKAIHDLFVRRSVGMGMVYWLVVWNMAFIYMVWDNPSH